jgi:SAM-dependent methyltransferase
VHERHYDRVEDLATAILDGLGHPETITIDDLAPADEFHLGGAAATAAIIDALGVGPTDRVLDIGSGLGGPARRVAAVTGAHVTGVDLTESFVATATHLSGRVGLGDRTTFHVGDATALDLDGPFDAATLIHVGMNIADKAAFFEAVHGLLVAGGRFVVYDIMMIGDISSIDYPMPFATDPDGSFLASPASYVDALSQAGFSAGAPIDRTQLALDAAAAAGAAGPPPVSLATVMGPDFATMFRNLGAALRAGALAPVQIVATRA